MCPFCNCITDHIDPEHAPYVVDGQVVCMKTYCRERAVAHLQGVQLALDLGIPYRREDYQLPLHLESP